MGIAQGATPYLMMTIEGFDLSSAAAIMVTLRMSVTCINLDMERVTVTSDGQESLLVVHLTQEETLALSAGPMTVQVRWRDAEGEAYTTEMAQINVAAAIYKGVI